VGNGPGEVTQLLQQWRAGDAQAQSALFEMLLPDLRRIAGYCFRGERSGHTLQPTALVNEAFVRLARAKNIDWQDRGHFFALAARIMRRTPILASSEQLDARIEGLLRTLRQFYGAHTPLSGLLLWRSHDDCEPE
jgi:RNA polymerase sigma factor (TIGR02999 family)